MHKDHKAVRRTNPSKLPVSDSTRPLGTLLPALAGVSLIMVMQPPTETEGMPSVKYYTIPEATDLHNNSVYQFYDR